MRYIKGYIPSFMGLPIQNHPQRILNSEIEIKAHVALKKTHCHTSTVQNL